MLKWFCDYKILIQGVVKLQALTKMKKAWGLVLLSVILMLTACGGGSSTGTEQQGASTQTQKAEYKFKLGHVNAVTHPYQAGAEKFKELVEQRSEGRIAIDIFASSTLGNSRDQIEGLQLGTVDFYVGSVAPVANFGPKLNILSMPYLFRDKEHAFAVLDGEIGQELADELPAKGIVNIAFWENGWRHMTNNVRPIKSASDVAGLKFRVQESPAYINFIKALKATPSPIPVGELYTALEQGVVDGQENPLAQIATNKFYEVQDYLSLTGHTYDPAVFLASKAVLDKLPDDLKQIVLDAAKEAGQHERDVSEKLSMEFLAELKSAGMTVEENPDIESFRIAVEPMYEQISNENEKELINKIRNLK
jgi:tripartite ATP-independent transporter DctP family solute receptor